MPDPFNLFNRFNPFRKGQGDSRAALPVDFPLITPDEADRLPRDLYALRLVGDALAPILCDGDKLVIDPRSHEVDESGQVGGTARAIEPGAAVLAHVLLAGQMAEQMAGQAQPHTGIYLINADGDLYDHRGTFHARGTYRIGGVVVGIQAPTPRSIRHPD